MEERKLKYRINEMLDRLSVKDNRKALHILPVELGISPATLNNYRTIGIDDKQDIPHTVVAQLEQFFGVAPGELQNFVTNIQPISALNRGMKEDKISLSKKYQLIKQS